MPKFLISETCSTTYYAEIEADNLEEANSIYEDGSYEFTGNSNEDYDSHTIEQIND